MWRAHPDDLLVSDLTESSEISRGVAWISTRTDFFDRAAPVMLARAPGRLDLMGGLADTSGGVVLAMPLSAATWVAAQPIDEPRVILESEGMADLGVETTVTMAVEDLVPASGPLAYESAHALLTRDSTRAWAAYAAGALVVLHRECDLALRSGVKLLIRSDVPVAVGVSSSAALEIAAFEVLAALAGAPLDDRGLALLGQKLENLIVGAPSSAMDQMTAACGRADHLIEIACQPAELIGHVALPADLAVFGVTSGTRDAISGADYGAVRTAAFMGYRIVADVMGFPARALGPGRVAVEDPIFGGYLANVPPSLWRARLRDVVPEHLDGRAFLAKYQGSTDTLTVIDPDRVYDVRVCADHAVEETHRARLFRALLGDGAAGESTRALLGELMYQAHASTSACGLGGDGTDRLVALARELGPAAGVYGAKITGGGSGGTVAILARRASRNAVEQLRRRYQDETGRPATLLAGSSPGSRAFGVRRLIPA